MGVTVTEPERGKAAALTLGLMLTEVALVLVQASVAVPLLAIVVGVPVRVAVGFAGSFGGGEEVLPPHAVSTTASNAIASTLTILRDGQFLDMS